MQFKLNIFSLFSILVLISCQQKIGSESSDSLVTNANSGVDVAVGLNLVDGAYLASDLQIINNCYDYRVNVLYSGEGSGFYWIDPDGSGGADAFKAYCDMEFDGGGWTLIGRGRESWAWNNSGQNVSSVIDSIGTSGAFVPAYLPATSIDSIIKNVDTSSLVDGVRIKRSSDITGSSYQEVLWSFSTATNWTWIMDSSIALSDTTIDGVSEGSGNTRDDYNNGSNDISRIFTWAWGGHANKRGFSYGSSASFGSNAADAFCFEQATENHCIPYTEVYVRQ